MERERPLGELLDGLDVAFSGAAETPVTGIAYDSRAVEPGNAFVAIPGFVHDGLSFVPAALEHGAVAVIAESARFADSPATAPACWATVRSARRALAVAACSWYEHPSRRLTVAGVTGTNGKTTVVALLERMLGADGSVGIWSTTRVQIGSTTFPTPRTTPESLELQRALAEMSTLGCSHAVIEVSSHALRLQRVAGTRFGAAVFTNLTPDHLDFHDDMDDYLDAKAALFRSLADDAPAVINVSTAPGRRLAAMSTGRVVSYGWEEDAAETEIDYRIGSLRTSAQGSELVLATPSGDISLATLLIGRANAENLAAATAAAMELGTDAGDIVAAVADFTGEPGRLEPVEQGQPFRILVDFAHTPGALEAAVEAARATTPDGRLIVVFGCGGDRDRAKRPLMGRIAATGADEAIVTSDNPRSESPAAIVDEILAGMSAAQRQRARVEVDRTAAIHLAIGLACEGDCVLIAGKGHETEQIFADRIVPFDDRVVATEALQRARVERPS